MRFKDNDATYMLNKFRMGYVRLFSQKNATFLQIIRFRR